MRALMWIAAVALIAAPVVSTPSAAYADGMERPRPRPPAPRPAPSPPLLGEREEARSIESNIVVLPASFFAGATGGVGADIGAGSYSSTVVVVRWSSAAAPAFVSASAGAGAGVRGGHGGRGGGRPCR